MLIALGMFIPRLFGKTISDRLARVLAVIILVVLGFLLFQLGKFAYDRSVINRYQTQQTAARIVRDQKAEQQADLKAAERTVVLEKANRTLEAAATEAAEQEPVKARATVGPVTRSYYDTLRKEKK